MSNQIKHLTCCCCGESTRGRQWHNRDKGFGLCPACAKWIESRGTGPKDMERLYGIEGVHYQNEMGCLS